MRGKPFSEFRNAKPNALERCAVPEFSICLDVGTRSEESREDELTREFADEEA